MTRRATIKKVKQAKEIVWYILQKLLSRDYRGRNENFFPELAVTLETDSSSSSTVSLWKATRKMQKLKSSQADVCHPTDVMYVMYLCAAPSLQQLLAEKMYE